MGRGRQKAKHTKVARELKYTVPETNYSALERELSGSNAQPTGDEQVSAWSEYYDDAEASGDEYDGGYQQRRA